jgi:hypothetical protein
MGLTLRRAVLLVALAWLHAAAQPGGLSLQPPVRESTASEYRAHVESLRGLVRACHDNAEVCDPAAAGDDEKVVSSSETFQVRRQWLRKLLEDAHDPKLADRNALLDQASARLDQELAGGVGAGERKPEFAQARRDANVILAQPEFRVVSGESWLDRKISQFWDWVIRFFSAAADIGHRAPWLGPVLEWGFVGLVILFLLIWAARTLQRERLAISLNSVVPASHWQKEADNWAELARLEAEKNNWREAIHCLYWASIIALESHKLWRRDNTRTPREYVELLEPNSPRQTTLRSITRIFERIWYGLRVAAHEDYAQALALFEELRRA